MNYVKLVNVKLSVEEISSIVSSSRCGAISLFVGTTRDNFQDQKVLQLEYEAYEPMAIKAMTDICAEIRTKWPSVEHIAIYHRLGIVPVKEASVVIAVSSPHRLESLEAVGHTIEALKASVPIWKKEVYESDKPAVWKENKELISNLSKKVCRRKSVEVVGDPLGDYPSHSTDQQLLGNIPFTPIDTKLVQIKADAQEIERRMKRFIDRKREDLNVINNRDFCNHTSVAGDENRNSCARVDALLVRRMGSKSHLRIRRVFNKWGPQTTRGNDPSPREALGEPLDDRATSSREAESTPKIDRSSAVEERLRNAEQHLRLGGPVPRDIYARLKNIEARILYLEGISPEYSSFWVTQAGLNPEHHVIAKPKNKKIYTLDDIKKRIQECRNKMAKK